MEQHGAAAPPAGGRPAEAFIVSVLGGRPGPVASFIRTGLALLAPVYCAGLKLYLLPYRTGIRRRRRLPCRVICVGNLTTGGTGKTPMTIAICTILTAAGLRVAVLSRGYGGAREFGCAVVSDGKSVLLSPGEAGDEAYLMATALPATPIVVGKDRRVSGLLACKRFQPDVILLDDGLQFWQLHRDMDIVLLNARAPFDNGWTFPRGLLREPPSHLRRAGIVVLTGAAGLSTERLDDLRSQVRRLAPDARVFSADFEVSGLSHSDGNRENEEWLSGRPVAALSALGNPQSFERLLESLGARIVGRFRFRDHSAIGGAQLDGVLAEAARLGACCVVTTAKDAVKLPRYGTTPPVLTLDVDLVVAEREEFVSALMTLVTNAAQ